VDALCLCDVAIFLSPLWPSLLGCDGGCNKVHSRAWPADCLMRPLSLFHLATKRLLEARKGLPPRLLALCPVCRLQTHFGQSCVQNLALQLIRIAYSRHLGRLIGSACRAYEPQPVCSAVQPPGCEPCVAEPPLLGQKGRKLGMMAGETGRKAGETGRKAASGRTHAPAVANRARRMSSGGCKMGRKMGLQLWRVPQIAPAHCPGPLLQLFSPIVCLCAPSRLSRRRNMSPRWA